MEEQPPRKLKKCCYEQPPVRPPFKRSTPYNRSEVPMSTETVYSESYRLPGRFVECDENHTNHTFVAFARNCDEVRSLTEKPIQGRNGLC